MKVKIDVKYDREWGEYCVRWIQNGRCIEEKCAYESDKDAAEGTRQAQIERALRQGYTVI